MDPLSLSCLVELLTTLGMIRYQSLTNSDDDRLWVELTSEPHSWTSFSDHSSVSSAAHRRGMNRTARLDTRSQARHVPATFVFSILDVDITIKYFIMFHVYFILRGVVMVICLERSAELHMAQLMPLPPTVCCSSKIQIGFTFLVPAHLGSPGQRAVKRMMLLSWNWRTALGPLEFAHMIARSVEASGPRCVHGGCAARSRQACC